LFHLRHYVNYSLNILPFVKNTNSLFAYALALRNDYKIKSPEKLIARNYRGSLFSFIVSQNPNYKIEPEDRDIARKNC